MSNSPFVAHLGLTDLGMGAALVVTSFRACAVGRVRCCRLLEAYDRVFGAEGPGVLYDMLAFARIVGNDGRRTVQLAQPGCLRLTADEVSLAALFAAAQAGEAQARDAHLLWLLAQAPSGEAGELVTRIAGSFADHGLAIAAPAAAGRQAGPRPQVAPFVHSAGRA